MQSALDLFKPKVELTASSLWNDLVRDKSADQRSSRGMPCQRERMKPKQMRLGEVSALPDVDSPCLSDTSAPTRTYRCLLEKVEGTFGVTLVSSRLFPYPRVLTLHERYKSTRSGLREGDRVLAVNGESVFGRPARATEILSSANAVQFLCERDDSPIQTALRKVSYRVKATSERGTTSKIPIRVGDLETLIAEANNRLHNSTRFGRHDDYLLEQIQVEYATLKNHIAEANRHYRRLAEDMSRIEEARAQMSIRAQQLDAREREIEKFVAAANELVIDGEAELDSKRRAYERELQYRQNELERKRRGHEAALYKRAKYLQAALSGKLQGLQKFLPRAPQQRATSCPAATLECGLAPGDRVNVQDFCNGTVKFVGEISGRIRVGVDLDYKKGFNDGVAKGHRYFWCAPGYGVFVVPEHVRSLGTREGDNEPSTPRRVGGRGRSRTPTYSPWRSKGPVSPSSRAQLYYGSCSDLSTAESTPRRPRSPWNLRETPRRPGYLEGLLQKASAVATAAKVSTAARPAPKRRVRIASTHLIASAGPSVTEMGGQRREAAAGPADDAANAVAPEDETDVTDVEEPAFFDVAASSAAQQQKDCGRTHWTPSASESPIMLSPYATSSPYVSTPEPVSQGRYTEL